MRTRILSRRTLLRGAGVAIGLPLLDAMIPKRARAESVVPQRAAFIYIPNGVISDRWTPLQVGRDWQLPFSLEPLAAVKDEITVVSGLNRSYVAGTQVHAQACACWLTSSPPSEVLDGGFPTNITLDQIIARHNGGDSLVPSLELSCNDFTNNQESRYFESISWQAPGFALTTEKNPQAVFDRLFGAPDPGLSGNGVLDVVLQNARDLRRRLGKDDQHKLDEYFESVRATELRIQRAEHSAASRSTPPLPRPTNIPEQRGDYLRLMGDLMRLAFQQDTTRVATLVVDPERWSSPRMFHGVFDKPQNHHMLTHDGSEAARQTVAGIDRFHMSFFAELIRSMRETRESGGTLLDNSLLVIGSGLGDGQAHSYDNLPAVVSGRAGGVRPGRHLHYEGRRPIADLWLAVLRAMNIHRDSFADSTGELSELFSG